MNAYHETTTGILDDLTCAVEKVEAEQQTLDEAIEARNVIILEAFRAGLPAETIAEKLGVLLADVELLMGADLLPSGRFLEPPPNGRT